MTIVLFPTNHTAARVLVDKVIAGGAVHAWVWFALVDVDGAVVALIPRRTLARVCIDGVRACPAVRTRSLRTVVDVGATGGAGEARRTRAGEPVHAVRACTAVRTRSLRTFIHIHVTDAVLRHCALRTVLRDKVIGAHTVGKAIHTRTRERSCAD